MIEFEMGSCRRIYSPL